MRWLSPLLLLAAAGCATHGPSPSIGTLAGQDFGPSAPRDVRTLILLLHSDGDGAVPAAFSGAAQHLADAIPHARAVALLRPGYHDDVGNHSPGSRGGISGDAYTADRISAVADTIRSWRARYPQARTILVGQSGGAAMAAALAGLHPGLVDGVVLAGCPCMLPEWRNFRAKQGHVGFGIPVTSFDPLMTVGGVAPATRVALLVGADDSETPQRFSRAYAEALALRGIATDYRVLPGRGHELLGDTDLIDAVRRMSADPAPVPPSNATVAP